MATIVFDQKALARLFQSDPVAKDLTSKAVTVERAAKRLAPVDTGRLRSSITHYLARDERGLVAYIGTNVGYAVYQEFGTRFQAGTPFLRPALRAAR